MGDFEVSGLGISGSMSRSAADGDCSRKAEIARRPFSPNKRLPSALREKISGRRFTPPARLCRWRVGPRPAHRTPMASIILAGVNPVARSLPARRRAVGRSAGAKLAFVASAAPARHSSRVAGPTPRGPAALVMPGAATVRGDQMMSRAAALDISAPAANDDKKQVSHERHVHSVCGEANPAALPLPPSVRPRGPQAPLTPPRI